MIAPAIPKHLNTLPLQRVDATTWRIPHHGSAWPTVWITKQHEGFSVHWAEPIDTRAAQAFRRGWERFGGRALGSLTGREVLAGQTSISPIRHPRDVCDVVCCARRLTLLATGWRDHETEAAWNAIKGEAGTVLEYYENRIAPDFNDVRSRPALRRQLIGIVARALIQRTTKLSPLADHLTLAERLQAIRQGDRHKWDPEISPQAR